MKLRMAVLVALSLLAASEAGAQCLLDLCFCQASAPRVAIGHVTGLVAEGGAAVHVDRWVGAAALDGGAPGDDVIINAGSSDAPGVQVLVGYSLDGVPVGRVIVDAAGTTVCRGQHFTVEQSATALAINNGERCVEQLQADGLKDQECHDVVTGCGCGSTGGVELVALLPLLRRRRRT